MWMGDHGGTIVNIVANMWNGWPSMRYLSLNQWRFWGLHLGGGSGVAIIAAGGTDLYCHSEPPLTSGKLCFIINFIGGTGGPEFLLGATAPPRPTAPLARVVVSVSTSRS